MRIKRRNKEDDREERDVASGCMGILFEVGVWTASTIFMTIGGALFIFGVFTFEPEITAGTLFALVAVPLAIIVFIRTGKAIIADLRNQR
jgi:uncharacterized membrane protein